MTGRVVGILVLLACLLGTSGCAGDSTEGYVSSPTFRDDVKTIAVPVFENNTYNRDVQYHLTEALIKEIQARTPYQIAPAGRADSVLLGRVQSVRLDQISKSRLTGLGEEVIASVTIDFEWKDLRSDRPLVARQGFAGHGLFVPSNPTGEPIEIGQYAAVQQLARDIVGEMRSDW